jgi:hypothetical protein
MCSICPGTYGIKAMAQDVTFSGTTASEKTLRDLARNASKYLPDFAEKDPAIGVK